MVTPIYAALLGLLLILLSFRVIKVRRRALVAVGTGDDPELLRATRVQGNFTEYVPLTLLLIWMLETQGAASPVFIHVLGVALLVGRCLHAYGVSQTQENLKLRISGMMMTFSVLMVSALSLLWQAV
ncbi:glutathione metabolism protein [Terasakiispira papahanaumokuakeensis]|uniref:Glutathione metabolism protein n=1 Tax=Terasakiispira papahanaumokuakeensis TaxID=197479 RepID=A0A1E2V7R6_9GAMM|nr:MAPEG family protein [Terasakiispira papahanaumokuakeensis]ODC03058.1 glutathione metabolism protein [Terasakiispira papahanaumokuakeensis]